MYTDLIGKLVSNLWSLETALRFYLLKNENKTLNEVESKSIGETISVNFFTNYFSLGNLIDEYNAYCNDSKTRIHKDKILSIRDTLAHGKIIIRDKDDFQSYCLIKFSKEKHNQVTIENKILINKNQGQWLKESIRFIADELLKIPLS